MRRKRFLATVLAGAAVLLLAFGRRAVRSQPAPDAPALHDGPPGRFLGPEKCAECHKPQHEVWNASKHSTSMRTVHREAIVPDLLSSLGGDHSMRSNATCLQCHYTAAASDEGAPEVHSAVSCEHCHGAASGWIKVHQDFGGPRAAETPEHKAGRVAAAKAAGMVYPNNYFAIATRCVECHELTTPSVDAATLSKMVRMNHPFNERFELVGYSQGTVRHRFYPPDLAVNKEMTPAELSRLFVIGQAAKLASARAAAGRSKDEAYTRLQRRQAEAAAAALKDVPEARALLTKSDPETVKAFLDAIADKDLTGAVGGRLPKKSELR
jgi:hypothetical protein